MSYQRICIFLIPLVFLVGCSTATNSQFIKPSEDLHAEPLEITNPGDKILLIYNHGSTPESEKDPCFPNNSFLPGGMPDVVKNLAGKKVAEKTVVVYAFCSGIQGVRKFRDTKNNLKIRYRINEITLMVERFKKMGVPAENIFLVGHSAGGWASLMIEANNPELVNSVIAFSPAFSGVKSRRNAQWQEFRNDQEKELSEAPLLDALVYAFRGDGYNSLQDLSFFSKIPGVEYHPLTGSGNLFSCYRGHRGAFKNCFEATEARTIVDYIHRRASIINE